MYIDTDKIVLKTAANQNFFAVARQNVLDDGEHLGLTVDERIDVVARRIMERHKTAFMELAK